MNEQNIKSTGCCPIFNPESWQDKEIAWNNKLFVKDSVTCFLHIPLNMESVITKMCKKIEKAGTGTEPENFILLSDETSPWKSIQYMTVKKETPEMENVKLSGTFLTKVFEGSYKEVKNWHQEMAEFVKSKGKQTKKVYAYYTTCPKCAKVYGKNYVVLLAQIN